MNPGPLANEARRSFLPLPIPKSTCARAASAPRKTVRPKDGYAHIKSTHSSMAQYHRVDAMAGEYRPLKHPELQDAVSSPLENAS